MGVSDIAVTVLMVLAAVVFAAAVGMTGLGLANVLEPFWTEVDEQSVGGVAGAGWVLVRRLGTLNRRLMWPSFEDSMRRKLVKAGEPNGFRPEDVMALQELGFLVGLCAGLVVMNALDFGLGWSLVVAMIGFAYPQIWVSDQIARRHLLISRALPFNLDLLTLSVEAGLDFAAALGRVVEKGRGGPLREELAMVLKQLKMGKTREEALKAMIARVDLPALSQFVTALVQADKMGTSLGKILRIQSTQLRVARTQRAEKLANEAPVKMLFPLIACIFPTVFMILFGPIVFAFKYGHVLD